MFDLKMARNGREKEKENSLSVSSYVNKKKSQANKHTGIKKSIDFFLYTKLINVAIH